MARLHNRCPDLRGTWRLNPPALPGNRLTIGGRAVHAAAYPWETMTIEGDAAQVLQITYSRSRERSELLWAKLEKGQRTPRQGLPRPTREFLQSAGNTAGAAPAVAGRA